MNISRDPDAVLATWLDDGPQALPDETRQAIVVGIRTVTQRRPGVRWPFARPSLPTTDLRRLSAALASATVVVLVVVLALGVYFNRPGVANPSPTPSATPASPAAFTEIAPGEMVEIPNWPLSERTSPPSVWTGAELIAWGDGIYGLAGDGAAFDLANGTWRVLAEAPLRPRSESAVAWTGTEMIVWGGRVDNSFFYDGAAYNPLTDTWRLLPFPGFSGKDPSMLWTGREAVVFGVKGDSDTSGEYIAAAAYDPVTDSWRALANAPDSVWVGNGGPEWWTGDSIVIAEVGYDPEMDTMARYDLAADQWTMLDVGSSAAVVGVPGADGNVSTFINLPAESGAPTRLIDTSGSLLAELPAFPGDPGVFGDVVGASGLWVGEEAVFEIWNDGPDSQPEQIWALNPGTQTWRQLDTETAFPRIDNSVRVAGDLLLFWNGPDDVYRGMPRVCCVAPPSKGGSIYRVGTTVPPEVP